MQTIGIQKFADFLYVYQHKMNAHPQKPKFHVQNKELICRLLTNLCKLIDVNLQTIVGTFTDMVCKQNTVSANHTHLSADATFSKEKVPRGHHGGNVARWPALRPGRTSRGTAAAVGFSGRRSLTERPPSRQPVPVLCTGLAAHLAAQWPAHGEAG